MIKIPKIFKNIRVIILILAIILAVLAIKPVSQDGVAIRFVEKDSAANLAGIDSPEKNSRPLDHEIITHINGQSVKNIEDYFLLIEEIEINRTIRISTNDNSYSIKTLPKVMIEYTGNTTTEIKEVFDEKTNSTINKTFEINETIETIIGVAEIGLTVYNAPQNNLKKGLDLQGGVRVLLQPEEQVNEDVLNRIVENLDQRLNAFGLNDVVIRKSGDLSGNRFILVEIAGLQKKEIEELIGSQGKFEAKIDNNTVFTGGEDIKNICRTADCSGIDPNQGCGKLESGGYSCKFFFGIGLSAKAALRQSEATKNLDVLTENGQQYLSSNIDLFLDGQEVNSLRIGSELKGRAETQIQISGVGSGDSREEAMSDALANMKKLQAIIQTGSLPVKLNIVKADNLSPILGKEFLRTALLTGLIALISVGIVILIRYRTLKIVIPVIISSLSELVILLGVSAMFGTNLDLAAIAGIIIVVGTGVDHLIVIADELLSKDSITSNLKEKIKSAFFIIMAAFFTTFVAMLPLVFAGAGILRGFALTTIYGVSIGVLITRPAYAVIVEYLLKK